MILLQFKVEVELILRIERFTDVNEDTNWDNFFATEAAFAARTE